jgi:hypothetical protein
MQPAKVIAEIPISSCPLCDEQALSIVDRGKKLLLFKNPDVIKCSNCGGTFFVSRDSLSVQYETLLSPYAYFNKYYSGWNSPGEATRVAEYIRSNSKNALTYLPNEKKHGWHIRIILDGTGDADSKSVSVEFSWEDKPATKEDAKRELARIRQIQKEIRQVKREMAQEMKEIRAYYGRSSANQPAKAAALEPYENTTLVADQALVQLDRAKLDIDNWVSDQL